jgi:hypothetical protein
MHPKRIRAQRWRPPSDLLVLAAVDRAHRHRFHEGYRDATLSGIARHLGMTWGPHASRRLRPIVRRLTDELGWLRQSRHRGQDRWALTDTGAQRLARALLEGVGDELPESPQHRQWRAAREHALVRIEALKSELGEVLAKVNAMLDSEAPAPATDWVACANALRELTVAVGIASYCLYERPEPDDAHADRDDGIQPSGSPVSWRYPQGWDPGYGD